MVVQKEENTQLDSQASAAVLKSGNGNKQFFMKVPARAKLEPQPDDFRVAFQ